MERIPVKANEIVAVGYDAAMQVLEVEFKDPILGVYQFFEVRVELYRFLMTNNVFNEEYFNLNIRDSYLCSRVS